MTPMTFEYWLREYWPWLLPFAWLVGYELYTIVARKQTLSQLVWQATKEWPPLPWVALTIVVILAAHFWIRLKD